MVEKAPDLFPINGLVEYYNNLVNYTKEIWDTLDNYKDTITALQHSHDSLYQWRLNEIIKTLTMFSIVIFSITFIAALFSVNPNHGMPFLNQPNGFWFVLGIIGLVGLTTIYIFKRKRWL
jgi:magnesium transporter